MSNTELLHFDNLPIWKGVTLRPGLPATAPFSLFLQREGFAKQDEKLISGFEQIYAHDEYSFITPPPGSSAWANKLGRRYIDFILEEVPDLEGKSVLEIGAGSLFVIETLLANHPKIKDVVVVDPAIRADEQEKIKIINDFFPTNKVTNQFDLVISANCFEHVLSPQEFLKGAVQRLKNETSDLILIFPDIENQFRVGDMNALLHEHISYFTQETGERLFAEFGLTVISRMKKENTLFYHLKLSNACNIPHDNLRSLVLENFKTSINFANDVILKEVSSGKKVAFHGATNGLNNTLFLSGLHRFENFQVFDGDTFKTDKFLPCSLKAIKNSMDESYRDFDVIYISAMTFFEDCLEFLKTKHSISSSKIKPLSPSFHQ